MLKFIKKNLKLKIMIPMIILFFTIGLIIYFITANSIKATLQAEFTSKGKTIVNTLASSVQETILNRDSSAVQGLIDQYRNIEGISFIFILDENNNIVAHTFYPKVPQNYLKIAREKIRDDLFIGEEILNEKRELVLSRPILNGLLGHIYLGMGIETRENEIIKPLIEKIIIIFGTCFLVSIFLITLILNILLKPILKLTTLAEEYSNGNFNTEKKPITSSDEVGRLTESIYSMTDKITKNRIWLEEEVIKRTEIINDQQLTLLNASKMSALGEMAGGIAHEINNPLAIIGMKIEQLKDRIDEKEEFEIEDLKLALEVIKRTTNRIAKIVSGLRFFARDGRELPVVTINLDSIIEDTLSFCSEKMRLDNIKLTVNRSYLNENIFLECRAVEISQVLLNLLNNSSDAISNLSIKWIQLNIIENSDTVEINVIDSGAGIPKELQSKIMQPFFTTKEVGKGTGLGLSISRGIIESHSGNFYIAPDCENTKIVMILPKNLKRG